jgi:methionyl-tRNA formyltransferase
LDKVRTILFGITGFGNSAVEALNKHAQIDLVAVLTSKREERPFAYYPCDHLYAMALGKRIPVYEGLSVKERSTFDFIHSLSPELIVVSTFDQIITKAIIQIPKYGVINIHPSLLPRYRGATPTVWALINGEEETGVSIHFIEDETIDRGRIILQAPLKIMPEDTDGTLRYRLAELSKTTLSRAIDLILIADRTSFSPQDESLATYYRKRTIKDAEISKDRPFKEILNRIRAMTPYPGEYITHNDSKYYVKSAKLLPSIAPCDNSGNDFFDFETSDGKVRFFTGGVVGR